jgi:hypothetical protein
MVGSVSLKQYARIAVVMLLSFVASESFASDLYLKLTAKDGKSYTAPLDVQGNFSFGPVPAGTYELSLVCPENYRDKKGGQKLAIESWTWGLSKVEPAKDLMEKYRETTGQATAPAPPPSNAAALTKARTALTKPFTLPAKMLTKAGENYVVIAKSVTFPEACTPTGTALSMALNDPFSRH